jgi:hypothetical protein
MTEDRKIFPDNPLKKIDLILETLRTPLANQEDEIFLRIMLLHELWTDLFLPWLDEKKCTTINYLIGYQHSQREIITVFDLPLF